MSQFILLLLFNLVERLKAGLMNPYPARVTF